MNPQIAPGAMLVDGMNAGRRVGHLPALWFGHRRLGDLRLSSRDAIWSGLTTEVHHVAQDGTVRDHVCLESPQDHCLVHIHAGLATVNTLAHGVRRAYRVRAGSTYLLRGDQFVDEVRWQGHVQMTALAIPGEMLAALEGHRRESTGPGLPAYRLTHGDAHIEALVGCIRRDLEAGCPGGPMFGESLSLALMQHLMRASFLAETPPRCAALSPAQRRTVEAAIEAGIGKPLSLASLAREAGLSSAHFSVCFKRTFGLTPHRYLLRTRVCEAQRLLREEHLPLSEIALCVGFADQSHFTQAFRRYTGVTPGKYRKWAGVGSAG